MAPKHDIAAFSARHHRAPPQRLGQRYDATRFLPEAGNTVVCHLDRAAPGHRAVLDARARLQALPAAERFLFTPIDSLHMTVFEGAIETRRTADAWPRDLPSDAPIEAVTQAVEARLAGVQAPPEFAVRPVAVLPSGLTLAGASDRDEAALRELRDSLTRPFGYRHADHDAYRFHMTFAYPLDWIPDDLVPVWEEGCRAILDDLVAAAPVIPLTAPAFCRFADMTRFEEILVLGS